LPVAMSDSPLVVNPLDQLSGTERQIAEYLVAGMNSSEIAKRLSVSYQTVAEAGKRIRHKLKVSTLAELRNSVRNGTVG